jgi:hypothetical protein
MKRLSLFIFLVFPLMVLASDPGKVAVMSTKGGELLTPKQFFSTNILVGSNITILANPTTGKITLSGLTDTNVVNALISAGGMVSSSGLSYSFSADNFTVANLTNITLKAGSIRSNHFDASTWQMVTNTGAIAGALTNGYLLHVNLAQSLASPRLLMTNAVANGSDNYEFILINDTAVGPILDSSLPVIRITNTLLNLDVFRLMANGQTFVGGKRLVTEDRSVTNAQPVVYVGELNVTNAANIGNITVQGAAQFNDELNVAGQISGNLGSATGLPPYGISASGLATNKVLTGTSGSTAEWRTVDASTITTGTLPVAQLPSVAVTNGRSAVNFGTVAATNFAGNGAGITNSLGRGAMFRGDVWWTNSSVMWVDKNGSDATGRRGVREYPFLSIAAANTAATVGDVILVGPGRFTNSASLFLKPVRLIGNGKTETVIAHPGTNGVILTNDNTTIADLAIESYESVTGYPLEISGTSTKTNIHLRSVKISGWYDNLFTSTATHLTVEACDFVAAFDNFNTGANDSNSVLTFNGCTFLADGNSMGGYTVNHNIANVAGFYRFNNCTFRAASKASGSAETICIYAIGPHGNVEVNNCSFRIDGSATDFYTVLTANLIEEIDGETEIYLKGAYDMSQMRGPFFLNGQAVRAPVGFGVTTNYTVPDGATLYITNGVIQKVQ